MNDHLKLFFFVRNLEQRISVLNIVEDTTVDGPGFRTAIYAAGCPRRCKGCHNPQSWSIENGSWWTIDAIMEKIKRAEFANVTFSGGDPLLQPEAFTELAQRIRRETDKTIWCYTGYRYEQVAASPDLSQILPFLDVLVDGPYIETLRNETLRFAGSENQRIIDVRASRNAGEVIEYVSDICKRIFPVQNSLVQNAAENLSGNATMQGNGIPDDCRNRNTFH